MAPALPAVFGVVSMHHAVPAMSHDHPVAAAAMEHAPDAPMHDDMMHLCLAVIGAVAGLLLILLLTFVWPGYSGLADRASSRRVDRPPLPAGRSLPSSLCVLRT